MDPKTGFDMGGVKVSLPSSGTYGYGLPKGVRGFLRLLLFNWFRRPERRDFVPVMDSILSLKVQTLRVETKTKKRRQLS